jgi:hypothetical protein
MDMKHFFGLVATILVFVAYVPYVKHVLSGKTKPHVYSWFIWGLLSVLVAALQFQKGAGSGAWMTLAAGLVSFLVFFLGLPNGKKDITKIDTGIFIAALFAAGIWLLAERPLTSMLLLVGAGVLGSIPTFRKSWHKPHEETLIYWSISPIRHGLSIFAITSYNTITMLNPLTWVVVNTCMSLLLIIRRRKLA